MRSRFPRRTLFLLAALLATFGLLVALYEVYLKNPPPLAAPGPVKVESAPAVPKPVKAEPALAAPEPVKAESAPAVPKPVKAEPAISKPARTKPIRVEAFLPLGSGCMEPMVEHLNALEKEYVGRIKVAYTDFSQPEGLKAMEARGFHCLTILVNGADRFTVKNPDGTERKTWFHKPPEAGNWKLEDLDQVIPSLLSRK